MVSQQFTITDELGIHARPATILVNVANKFEADVKLVYNQKTVNLKSILGVMSLGIAFGSEFDIKADGSDEQKALNELEKTLLNEKLAKISVRK
ncbi:MULTISPECIES: phosphocarrier protein HPr [Planococcus]|uniref:Phosphocarrier protein HPr n=1 Tax=Planococcus faecalis TaxID=1598147 RepID=A0ABM6ISM6_9BACL|nr:MULTISPECIES: phosphocarrier protein HPr [Planococcus]AQU79586.1 phosphocarrier protein HPr [Planococcus faecalis]KAA0958156.1 phosphocarrier protein HPr [Planococcus sp. ANT_H30]MDJ0331613.1 phosphocarrier protein HPr [Planococcus sp. S3-L1]